MFFGAGWLPFGVVCLQGGVDDVGEPPFEDSEGFQAAVALGLAAGHHVPGWRVPVRLGAGDPVQGRGLRHAHQTAMRRDRVPRVLRRERLGHGRSGDIADHCTHIDDEMIIEMLASLTRRLRSGSHGEGPDRSSARRPTAFGGPVSGRAWLAPVQDPVRERSPGLRSQLRSQLALPEPGECSRNALTWVGATGFEPVTPRL